MKLNVFIYSQINMHFLLFTHMTWVKDCGYPLQLSRNGLLAFQPTHPHSTGITESTKILFYGTEITALICAIPKQWLFGHQILTILLV